jgi:hypothetical protein
MQSVEILIRHIQGSIGTYLSDPQNFRINWAYKSINDPIQRISEIAENEKHTAAWEKCQDWQLPDILNHVSEVMAHTGLAGEGVPSNSYLVHH